MRKEYPKLTKWANEPKVSDLMADRDMADADHSEFTARLEGYRETLAGGPNVKVRKGKSKVKPLLARKHLEWKIPSLVEPFLSTEDMYTVIPRTADDKEKAKQNELLLNYFWSTKVNKTKLIDDIGRTVAEDGTVIVKTGWYTKETTKTVQVEQPVYASAEESYEIISRMIANGKLDPAKGQALIEEGELVPIGTEMVEEEVTELVENHPTYEVCITENVVIDPTCEGDMDNAQFIIHEYELDKSVLMNDKYDAATGKGYYKNLSEIDFKADNRNWGYDSSTDNNSIDTTNVFSDETRKKVRVLEYWGYWDIKGDGTKEAIVATWIGDVMVRLQENPFPHKKLPFSIATYMPVRGKVHGEPDAALLKDNQDTIRKMTRAYQDITTTKAVGQKLVDENTFGSQAEWDSFERGNTARFRAGIDIDRAIKTVSVDKIDPAIMQVIDRETQEAQALSSIVPFSPSNAGSSISNSATGVKSAMDATSKRELSVLKRLSNGLMQHMGRLTVANMQAFLEPEKVVRITESKFITVSREDIQGEFDLTLDIRTPEKDAADAQQMMTLLQTGIANVDPRITNIMLADLLRLWKRPRVAKMVEELPAPEPSPEEQELMAMNQENARLQNEFLKMQIANMAKDIEEANSRLAERDSRTEENAADIELKRARAAEAIKRAEHYESQTDILDAKFMKEQDGTARRHEIDDMVYKEEAKAYSKLASTNQPTQQTKTGE